MLEFILVEQDVPPIPGLKSCFELGVVQRIYSFKEESLEREYADVFEDLGEIRGVQHKIKIDPKATPVIHSLVIAKKKNNKIKVCLDPSDLN